MVSLRALRSFGRNCSSPWWRRISPSPSPRRTPSPERSSASVLPARPWLCAGTSPTTLSWRGSLPCRSRHFRRCLLSALQSSGDGAQAPWGSHARHSIHGEDVCCADDPVSGRCGVPPADRCRIARPRVMPAQRVERAVRMGRSTISSLAITGFLTIGAASAAHDQQAKAIYTASQSGAVNRGAPNVTYSSRKLFLASTFWRGSSARASPSGLRPFSPAKFPRSPSLSN
jgi:hypothetical protein